MNVNRKLVLTGIVFLFLSQLAFGGDSTPTVTGKAKLGYGFEAGLVSGKDYVSNQLIVGFKSGMSTTAVQNEINTVSRAGGKIKDKINSSALLVEFNSEENLLLSVNELVKSANVAFVERNGFMSIPPTPDLSAINTKFVDRTKASKLPETGKVGIDSVSADKATGFQWHHTVIRKTAVLPALSASPPTVAVIDTGVDYTHTDLSAPGKVILGKNVIAQNNDPYDDNGHGTHVAGLIAASAANGYYGEGVSPNSKILAVKVLNNQGWGSFFDVAQGMSYVRTSAASVTPAVKVVNMSLGGSNSALVATEVLNMKNAGLLLVASAGNNNTSLNISFPGGDPNTGLRVMATEQNDARAWFSNFCPATASSLYNIAAPGWNIYSTVPGEGFTSMSGTSMASPIVAGAAALVWGQLPTFTRDQIISRIVANGQVITKGFVVATRRLDVRKAITGTAETAMIGRILDPFNGLAPSPDTTADTAKLLSGSTQLALDATNRAGFYEFTSLAAGSARQVTGTRASFIPAGLRQGVNIAANVVNGPYTDAHPRTRAAGSASITVDWKTVQPVAESTEATPVCSGTCLGWDFDLMVKQPSGSYIYFGNMGDLATTPYIYYPRDSYDDLEPLETVVIAPLAANGVYKVFVDNWNQVPWNGSLAAAQIYLGTTLYQNFALYPSTCGSFEYWYVGNLTKTGNAYAWTSVNTCSNTMP